MKYISTLLIILFLTSCSNTTPIPKKSPQKNSYLNKIHLDTLNFHGKELISIYKDNKYYYVRKDGKIMQTLTYDNAADEFSDGLARTKINGKIGFFNSNLEMVLKPIYDFAFPFHNGTAEICMGCKEKKDEEHSMLDGGKWKKIDRTGLVIE